MNVMMSKFTITERSNGKPILQLNGYELRHVSANKNGTTGWRCIKKARKAIILYIILILNLYINIVCKYLYINKCVRLYIGVISGECQVSCYDLP